MSVESIEIIYKEVSSTGSIKENVDVTMREVPNLHQDQQLFGLVNNALVLGDQVTGLVFIGVLYVLWLVCIRLISRTIRERYRRQGIRDNKHIDEPGRIPDFLLIALQGVSGQSRYSVSPRKQLEDLKSIFADFIARADRDLTDLSDLNFLVFCQQEYKKQPIDTFESFTNNLLSKVLEQLKTIRKHFDLEEANKSLELFDELQSSSGTNCFEQIRSLSATVTVIRSWVALCSDHRNLLFSTSKAIAEVERAYSDYTINSTGQSTISARDNNVLFAVASHSNVNTVASECLSHSSSWQLNPNPKSSSNFYNLVGFESSSASAPSVSQFVLSPVDRTYNLMRAVCLFDQYYQSCPLLPQLQQQQQLNESIAIASTARELLQTELSNQKRSIEQKYQRLVEEGKTALQLSFETKWQRLAAIDRMRFEQQQFSRLRQNDQHSVAVGSTSHKAIASSVGTSAASVDSDCSLQVSSVTEQLTPVHINTLMTTVTIQSLSVSFDIAPVIIADMQELDMKKLSLEMELESQTRNELQQTELSFANLLRQAKTSAEEHKKSNEDRERSLLSDYKRAVISSISDADPNGTRAHEKELIQSYTTLVAAMWQKDLLLFLYAGLVAMALAYLFAFVRVVKKDLSFYSFMSEIFSLLWNGFQKMIDDEQSTATAASVAPSLLSWDGVVSLGSRAVSAVGLAAHWCAGWMGQFIPTRYKSAVMLAVLSLAAAAVWTITGLVPGGRVFSQLTSPLIAIGVMYRLSPAVVALFSPLLVYAALHCVFFLFIASGAWDAFLSQHILLSWPLWLANRARVDMRPLVIYGGYILFCGFVGIFACCLANKERIMTLDNGSDPLLWISFSSALSIISELIGHCTSGISFVVSSLKVLGRNKISEL